MLSRWPAMRPLQLLLSWPRRRWAVVAVLVAPLTALYVSAGGGRAWALPVAAGMVAFGLGRRLTGAVSCPTPR